MYDMLTSRDGRGVTEVIVVERRRRPAPWSVSIYRLLRYGNRIDRIVILGIFAFIVVAVLSALIGLGIAAHHGSSY